MMTTNRIILAAGGTGGHVIPALTVSHELKNRGFDCKFLSDKRGLKLIDHISPKQKASNVFAASPVSGNIFQRLVALFKISLGVIQSIFHIIHFRPFCVVGFGGYPSAPPLIAASIFRLPSLLHEQNARVGRANLFLAAGVKTMLLSWKNSKPIPPNVSVLLTGLPVRSAFFELPNYQRKKKFSVKSPCHILIIGGSLGAQMFADFIPQAISALPENIRKSVIITQQVCNEQLSELQRKYSRMSIRHFCKSFFTEIVQEMAKADIIISRAGASSVAEVAAIGRAAVFIPFPESLDDHQVYNARSLTNEKAAILLPQKEIEADPTILAKHLLSLIEDPKKCQKMAERVRKLAHKDALNDIIASVKSCQKLRSGGVK